MAETLTKIIEVRLDDEPLLKSLRDINAAIEENKARQRELDNQRKAGAIDNETLKSLNVLKVEQKAYQNQLSHVNREIQNNIKKQNQAAGSYDRLQSELRKMVAQYKAMSEAEREGAEGAKLLKDIDATTKKLKSLDEGMGVYNRNVGNYVSALSGISPAVGQAAQAVASGAQKMGIALSTGPLVILTAIGVAFKAVYNAFKSNEEAAMSLRVAYAPLQGIFVTLADGAQTLAGWLGKALEYISGRMLKGMQAVAGVVDKIFGTESQQKVQSFSRTVADNAEQLADIERRNNELIKERRAYTVTAAEDELRISELRYKANRKDLYTAEERLGFIKEASALQLKNAQEAQRLAKIEWENFSQKISLSKSSTEELDKEAELRARMIQTEKAYYDQQRELSEKVVSYTREIEAERKAAAEAEERRQAALIALQQRVQDATIAMMAEGYDKEVALATNASQKRLQALDDELKSGVVTAEAYSVLRKQIEQDTAQAIAKARKNADEQAQKDAQAAYDKRVAELTAQYKNEALVAQKEGKSLAEVQLAQLQRQYTDLAALREEFAKAGYATELDYANALLEAEAAIEQKRTEIAKAEAAKRNKVTQDGFAVASALVGGLSSLVSEEAEQNERYANFAKALAITQIAIDTAKGIAAAVAAGAGVPFPANLGAIAAGITSVLSGIAGAKNALSQAGNAPKFHDGGTVEGSGEVAATLLAGESVMTRATTANFGAVLSELNVASGGNTIAVRGSTDVGDSYLGALFRQALDDMPAPVVSVVDITRKQKQVAIIQRNARRAG